MVSFFVFSFKNIFFLPDSSQSLIEPLISSSSSKFDCCSIKNFNGWVDDDGLARISQMLNVRRIEDDLTGDIEEELISIDEYIRFVKVICMDDNDEGEDVDGFVTNLSSLIRIDSDLENSIWLSNIYPQNLNIYQQKRHIESIILTNYDYNTQCVVDN